MIVEPFPDFRLAFGISSVYHLLPPAVSPEPSTGPVRACHPGQPTKSPTSPSGSKPGYWPPGSGSSSPTARPAGAGRGCSARSLAFLAHTRWPGWPRSSTWPSPRGAGRALWDEPSESWVEVPEHLSGTRYVAIPVAGESMLPVMHPGDVVLVELGGEVARDTVVVARLADDGYVVKRVAQARADEIELASLNPEFAPIILPRDDRSIVGRVVMRWCDHDPRPSVRSPEMRLAR